MLTQKRLFAVYCIDSSSLINLKPYRKDIFPTIWERLEVMINNEEIISPLQAYDEIKIGKDEIHSWCKKHKKMFKDINQCQMQKIQDVKKYYENIYWRNEINKTVPWADPWIIALSICEDAIIVSDEKNAPNKIPFIASAFGIKCLKLLDFFKEIGIRY